MQATSALVLAEAVKTVQKTPNRRIATTKIPKAIFYRTVVTRGQQMTDEMDATYVIYPFLTRRDDKTMLIIGMLGYSHDGRVVIKMTLTLVKQYSAPWGLPVVSIASSPFSRHIVERIVLILVATSLVAFPYGSKSHVDHWIPKSEVVQPSTTASVMLTETFSFGVSVGANRRAYALL